MSILRDISLIYTSIYSLIVFLILFQPKYEKKKFVAISLAFVIPLMIVNFILFFILGIEKMAMILLVTCSLPSLIFFWFLAKYHGGRFIFTFCFADTITLELIYTTSILDYYLGNNYIVMFVLRLILCPVLALMIYKYLRPTYIELQNKLARGWMTFSAISIIFYVVLSVFISYPSLITERPVYIPPYILLLILMPLLYLHFFSTLRYQQKNHEIMKQESIMLLQMTHMKNKIEEFHMADNKFRMERHNFRHKLQTIAGLMDKEEYSEVYSLLRQYNRDIQDTQLTRYCHHPIIDSALSAYLHLAKSKGISLSTELDFPDKIPVNESDLAMVFANAIENAIHACMQIEAGRRHLEIRVISSPHFMLQIRNSFNGIISFDEKGIPLTTRDNHGFGTRSIVAFCEKYNSFYQFKAENSLFSLQIMIE